MVRGVAMAALSACQSVGLRGGVASTSAISSSTTDRLVSSPGLSFQKKPSGAGALTTQFKGAALPIVPASLLLLSKRRAVSLSARSALVQKVTAKELDDILTNARTSPMIIDFYATWCGPCIVLAQQLEQLAVEYGDDVRFLKVDTDEEHELASQMDIRGLPTMVFVSTDAEKLAIRTEGLLPTDTIRNIIETEL